MNTFKVRIEGVTPLLMNKPKEYEGDSNVDVRNKAIESDEDVRRKIYVLGGKVYQPATQIRGALVNAAKDLRVKGKGKATYSKLIASMVMVEPEAIPHLKKDFDIHIVRGVNPSTRGAVMIKRPRLKEWALEFSVVADEEIPADVLREAFDRAGKYVGIGDWRPGTKGVHGKFQVTKFEAK